MQNPRDIIQPSLSLDPGAIAYAENLQRLDDIDLDPLQIYNLLITNPEALPFLAEQFSMLGLEGFHWAGTDEERRQLVRDAIPQHKLKGTLEGYRTILRRTKQAQLYSYISPPDIPYPSAELTKDEEQRFLAQMPQIRLYRYDRFGTRQGIMLRGSYLVEDAEPEHKLHFYIHDAQDRFWEKPELWHPDGRIERLRWWARETVKQDGFATTTETVIRPGKPLGTFLVNSQDFEDEGVPLKSIGIRNAEGNSFLIDHDPMSRIYYLENAEPYSVGQDTFVQGSVTPGYEQLRVRYDFIQERSTMKGQMFGRIYLAPEDPFEPEPLPVPPDPEIVQTTLNFGGSTYAV